jgi:lysophospholipase L1-like esterase
VYTRARGTLARSWVGACVRPLSRRCSYGDLALGDSISIDDYTGVPGGGAASQLARKLGFDLIDLTRDGNTTQGVLADLARAPTSADVVTLTAGGNDLLGGESPRAILRRLDEITQRLQPLGGRTVVNNVYDPSDGDNAIGRADRGRATATGRVSRSTGLPRRREALPFRARGA